MVTLWMWQPRALINFKIPITPGSPKYRERFLSQVLQQGRVQRLLINFMYPYVYDGLGLPDLTPSGEYVRTPVRI